jgi:hypothetical protein
MFVPRHSLLLLVMASTACASVPRGPAATLADAGLSATSAFGTDVRDLRTRLVRGDVGDAFTQTWLACQNANPSLCEVKQPSSVVRKERLELASAIMLRAKAIDALHQAYAALKTEATYDARADLVGSVDRLVAGVNSYATAVGALAGGAPAAATSLISRPLAAGLSFGAGIYADQKQRSRILAANRAIGEAATRLRDAMAVEALLQAGIASPAESARPLLTELNLAMAKDAEAAAKTLAGRTAIEAVVEAAAYADALALASRYQASIGALTELTEMHADLAAKQPINLKDIIRFLDELDAALSAATKE